MEESGSVQIMTDLGGQELTDLESGSITQPILVYSRPHNRGAFGQPEAKEMFEILMAFS
jgi:hypothetical protein